MTNTLCSVSKSFSEPTMQGTLAMNSGRNQGAFRGRDNYNLGTKHSGCFTLTLTDPPHLPESLSPVSPAQPAVTSSVSMTRNQAPLLFLLVQMQISSSSRPLMWTARIIYSKRTRGREEYAETYERRRERRISAHSWFPHL